MAVLPGLLAVGPAMAAEPRANRAPTGETVCDTGAWARDADPAGVAIRAAPRATARQVGRLPATDPQRDPDYEYSVQFRIVAARDGWLKITDISDDYNARPRPMYAGTGWIVAEAARVQIQSGRGYLGPNKKNDPVIDLKGDWLTDMGEMRRIRACSGDWVLVDYVVTRRREPGGGLTELDKADYRPGTAWFRGVCSSQETTCDMASVD